MFEAGVAERRKRIGPPGPAVYALEGLSVVATDARKAGIVDPEVNVFTVKALFSTLTNVDFDPERFVELIGKAAALRDALADKAKKAGAAIDEKTPCAAFAPQTSADALTAQAAVASLKAGAEENADIRSLQHILLFGIKGVAAYADHAQILGRKTTRFTPLFRRRSRPSARGKPWI